MFSPVIILVGIAIKLDSKGPILADTPERVGRNGKLFKMYKFRSMVENAHELLRENPKFVQLYRDYKKGSYKLKDDNPYLPLEEIDLGLLEAETSTVIKATHLMMKKLLPIFRKQGESRIAIITSMSAIRGYSLGGTHCAAKGAIDRYANAAMLGLYKNNIFITAIRPGGVDTGMYDNPKVQDAIKVISGEYKGIWDKQITLAPPTAVGEAVNYVFTTPAHIPSLNLVAKGQFPHEGS